MSPRAPLHVVGEKGSSMMCRKLTPHQQFPEPLVKPLRRRLEFAKPALARFGADLCRINSRIFVLNVHTPRKRQKSVGGQPECNYTAYRLGLRRFDEVYMINEEHISHWRLDDVYNLLQKSSELDVTVQEAPLVVNHSLPVDQLRCMLGSGALSVFMDGEGQMAVPTVLQGRHAHYSSSIPQGIALIEVDGTLVLGMTGEEVAAVLQYACAHSTTGSVTLSTMVPDYARAFLAALLVTVDVYGNSEWRPKDMLRKTKNFQIKRRESQRIKHKLSSSASSSGITTCLRAPSSSPSSSTLKNIGRTLSLKPSTSSSSRESTSAGAAGKLKRVLSSILMCSREPSTVAKPEPSAMAGAVTNTDKGGERRRIPISPVGAGGVLRTHLS